MCKQLSLFQNRLKLEPFLLMTNTMKIKAGHKRENEMNTRFVAKSAILATKQYIENSCPPYHDFVLKTTARHKLWVVF